MDKAMTADDIETYKWLEFVARKLGTRHWTVGRRLSRDKKRLGYQKAITPTQLEKLREQFEAGRA